MTVIVARNASGRTRGFLASVALELAPGVYCAPRMSPAVRERVWEVLREWFPHERDASLVLLWREPRVPGEIAVRTLGVPPVALAEVDGLVLSRRSVEEARGGSPE
ncbi:MAG: type I-E CRISPR-associated endoribonuclease Cas2e [Dehalococcoidia bacterium]|nr:type I-E CRISPR-associated endoribonuclease Cas2e [Dehalococcoidia bacterium]